MIKRTFDTLESQIIIRQMVTIVQTCSPTVMRDALKQIQSSMEKARCEDDFYAALLGMTQMLSSVNQLRDI